jgi:sugar phosphate isomerase/epimerase
MNAKVGNRPKGEFAVTINRREVLLGGAAAAAAGLGGAVSIRKAQADEPKPKAVLKLASQLNVIPGGSLEERLDKMAKWQLDGVELRADIVDNEKMYADALKKAGVKVSAICYGSIGGALVSEDPEKRKPAFEEFKRVITSAGELGSTGVVYVPAFNGQTKLRNQEIRQVLVDTLPALGEHAVQCGTRIVMEPLNRREAYFLRQLADAASICRDCNTPGVCMMGDFYHMYIEETSDLGAFISGGDYVHHVHLASRARVLPGQDERSFIDGFRGLKMIGYQDYCSFECGVRGNRDVEIPKSLEFLKEQWSQA